MDALPVGGEQGARKPRGGDAGRLAGRVRSPTSPAAGDCARAAQEIQGRGSCGVRWERVDMGLVPQACRRRLRKQKLRPCVFHSIPSCLCTPVAGSERRERIDARRARIREVVRSFAA
jgi:hypothetical protein